MKKRNRFGCVWFWAVMIFLYLPLLLLVFFSFNDSRTFRWAGVSLRWYRELFCNSRDLWHSMTNSAIIALGSSAIATIIGTCGAIGIQRFRFRFRGLIRSVSFLPILLPEIIIGVALLLFFAAIRLPLGLGSIFIAHTTFNIPFVLLVVLARLDEFDQSIVEAAYDLGASELATLFRVILPLAMPGIMAAFLMAVTLSLEDFVITFFVAGPGSSTLPLHVYSMIRFGVSPVINALSVVMISATVLLAVLFNALLEHRGGRRRL